MRLQRFLSQAGIASRRKAEEIILSGRITVNGKRVSELGSSVSQDDAVAVDGKRVSIAADRTYLALNKPAGVVTTMRDPQGRRTVTDLLPRGAARVVPVGRLDYDTAGLLLLTNDGELAHVLTHPRYGVEKTYRVVVGGRLTREDIAKLQDGIRLEEFRAAPAKVRVVAARADRSVIDITIHEGRNRQVRRMLEALGHPVWLLERRAFGPISLGPLRPGQVRQLARKEIAALRALVTKTGPQWNRLRRSRKNTG